MLRALLAVLAFFLSTPVAEAFDIEAMSNGERAVFRSEIRDYLIENPEVIMEAIAVLERRRGEQDVLRDATMLEDNHEAIFDDGVSYVGGNPDGDVTIVEFLDYRCGYCKRAFPSVEELISSDGQIRFIVKEFPILGEQSSMASRYAIATKISAGDEAYKRVHDRLMTHNGQINIGFLIRLSGELDLDHQSIAKVMSGDEVSDIIAENRALGSRLEIQGTPSFVMGDNFVRGYVELDQMRTIVASIRKEQG